MYAKLSFILVLRFMMINNVWTGQKVVELIKYYFRTNIKFAIGRRTPSQH